MSTLRQGQGYIPLHGSFWDYVLDGRIRDRNPFNPLLQWVKSIADKCHILHHFEEDRPDPRWSVGQLADYVRLKCVAFEDDTINSLRLCFDPCRITPSISSYQNGLFPMFETDIFGIQGVAGLSQWIIDSGATSSCTSDLTLFKKISYNPPFKRIRVANGKFAAVTGVGEVDLRIVDSKTNSTCVITLYNVLYIPEVPVNLISTRALWNDTGIKTTFSNVCNMLMPDKKSITFDTGSKGHYYCVAKSNGLHVSDEQIDFGEALCTICEDNDGASAFATAPPISADTVHARMGHCGPDRAVQTLRRSIGLPEQPNYRKLVQHDCEGCRLGGARKHPMHAIPDHLRPQKFGDRVHSDLCGPFPVSVSGSYEYILSFVDSATGYSEIYLLQSKLSSEVKKYFHAYVKKHADILPNGKIKEWFTDNGGEFTSSDIEEFVDEFIAKRGYTVPYCSPQNAQAERLWGILQRTIRILLAHSGMPTCFWHYAALQANILHNLLPRRTNPDSLSPHEAVYGTKPDFTYVRVWGCLTYCTLRNEKDVEDRASSTGVKAALLGRDERRRGWIVYIPSLNRITTSFDVNFVEDKFLRFDKTGKVMDDTSKFVDDDESRVDPVRVYNDTLQPAAWRNGQRDAQRNAQPLPAPQPSPNAQQNDHVVQPGPFPTNARRRGTHEGTRLPPRTITLDPSDPNYRPSHDTMRHGTDSDWSPNHCQNAACTYPRGHAGPCSDITTTGQGNPRGRLRSQNFVSPEAIYFKVPHTVSSNEEDHSNDLWSIELDKFGEVPIPATYEEAMASRFAHLWKEAMNREIRELQERGTWDPESLPKGRKCVPVGVE